MIPQIDVWHDDAVQKIANCVEVEDAEIYGTLWRRPNTIQHRRLAVRSCTSELFWNVLGSNRLGRRLPRYTRTTPHELGGETTSLADENEPSTLTAGSTQPYFEMRLVKVPIALPIAHIVTKGLHLQQVLTCVDGLLGRKSTSSTYGTFVLKKGVGCLVCLALRTSLLPLLPPIRATFWVSEGRVELMVLG